MKLIAALPADVVECSLPLEPVIAQRVSGARPLPWSPIDVSALEPVRASDLGTVVVCFSGDAETAARVDKWREEQSPPILHLKLTSKEDADHLANFSLDTLKRHCEEVFAIVKDNLDPPRRTAFEQGLANWAAPDLAPTDHPPLAHNIFLPNQMSLRRSYRRIEEREGFVGDSEVDYSKRIVESAAAVCAVRDSVGRHPVHRLMPPTPDLILSEPALYRMSYRREKPAGIFEEKAVAQTLRRIQSQRGLFSQIAVDDFETFKESKNAQSLMMTRQEELQTHTLGVGLRAASNAAAVVRLSPGVNHVFPKLSAFARSVRSDRPEARLKARRLFTDIQKTMTDALGAERMELIESRRGPVKIVSDCPIEWLPIDGLPLALARDCSRINATPGNVMMTELARTQLVTVPPEAFRNVLVVSAFEDGDPLRDTLLSGLVRMNEMHGEKISYVAKCARTRAEFIAALNAYDGSVLIFDGHGVANSQDPVGALAIGSEHVDVWTLRGEARVPPIVITSACDTHAVDGISHATVGNGFLALGARTVLATMLPVGGHDAAVFIGRFMLRLADYLPAALAPAQRVLTWTEVVAGMLRMTLVSEIISGLAGVEALRPQESSPIHKLQIDVYYKINTRQSGWYDALLEGLAPILSWDIDRVRARADGVISRSEAIRYIQLGNPETILIDEGAVERAVINEVSRSDAKPSENKIE